MEHLPQGVLRLECCLLSEERVASTAQPPSELRSNLDLVERLVRGQSLRTDKQSMGGLDFPPILVKPHHPQKFKLLGQEDGGNSKTHLAVGVDRPELHSIKATIHHSVDSIASSPSTANHFDFGLAAGLLPCVVALRLDHDVVGGSIVVISR